jgi:hypothetical protein
MIRGDMNEKARIINGGWGGIDGCMDWWMGSPVRAKAALKRPHSRRFAWAERSCMGTQRMCVEKRCRRYRSATAVQNCVGQGAISGKYENYETNPFWKCDNRLILPI